MPRPKKIQERRVLLVQWGEAFVVDALPMGLDDTLTDAGALHSLADDPCARATKRALMSKKNGVARNAGVL